MRLVIYFISLLIVLSGCTSYTPTYIHKEQALKSELFSDFKSKDLKLLLERKNIKYTSYDNFINVRLIRHIYHEISPDDTHIVTYVCLVNYSFNHNKMIVRVFDLKVQRLKGKTTQTDYDLCRFHVESTIKNINTMLENQIKY